MKIFRFYTGGGTEGFWDFSQNEITQMRNWLISRFNLNDKDVSKDAGVIMSEMNDTYGLGQWIIDNNLGENPL